MLTTSSGRGSARPKRIRWVSAVGAVAVLLISVLIPAVAQAAPPSAGDYEGSSSAYTGATVSFEIDADGRMSNFDSESYCSDGFGVYPVQWTGMPATQIEAGVPFDIEWTYDTGDVSPYYELTGTVNADGSASGTGRAGFLPYGTCGGMNFTWTAERVGGGDPDPVDPTITISPTTVTESELADPGIRIDGEGFPGSDWVDLYVNGAYEHRTMAAWDGTVAVFFNSDDLGAGTHDIRLANGDSSASGTFTVTADPVTYDPSASVSPTTLSESDLADSGVTVTGEGFAPDSSVTFSVNGDEVDSATANGSGGVSFPYTSSTLGAGTHDVELSSADGSDTASFTVTEDPVVYDPSASVSPSSLSESDLAATGVTITGTGFAPNSNVTLSINGTQVSSSDASAGGDVTFTHLSSTLGTGSHDVELTADEGTATASFTVTEDPVVYNPSMGISPSIVTESELAATGISVTGDGFPANVAVELSVGGSVVDTASSDGSGSVEFTYTSNSLGAGEHAVGLSANADGASISSTFTVTEDPVGVDPTASASPSSLTETELATTGVTIAGFGFEPGSEVTLTVGGQVGDSATADVDGAVTFTYTSGSLGVGNHDAVLSSGDLSATASFTVTADPVVYYPSIGLSPSELSESELADSGVSITGSGFPSNALVELTIDGQVVDSAISDALGSVAFTFSSDSLAAGTYSVGLAADAEGATIVTTLTVTADDSGSGTIPATPPAETDLDPGLEGAITVPESAEPGGTITIQLSGVAPGTEVGVWMFSDPVYLGAHTVNAQGQVVVTIPANIAAGEHTIAVWDASGAQIGWDTITIVAADAGDGGDGGDGAGGAVLPATGATSSWQAVLLGLLTLGAGVALVARANRRRTLI